MLMFLAHLLRKSSSSAIPASSVGRSTRDAEFGKAPWMTDRSACEQSAFSKVHHLLVDGKLVDTLSKTTISTATSFCDA